MQNLGHQGFQVFISKVEIGLWVEWIFSFRWIFPPSFWFGLARLSGVTHHFGILAYLVISKFVKNIIVEVCSLCGKL
jgi:hypothetical protein